MALRAATIIATAFLAAPALAQQYDPGLDNNILGAASPEPIYGSGDAETGSVGIPARTPPKSYGAPYRGAAYPGSAPYGSPMTGAGGTLSSDALSSTSTQPE